MGIYIKIQKRQIKIITEKKLKDWNKQKKKAKLNIGTEQNIQKLKKKNEQKNGTFDIEHIYSQNYNAIKAHYFFIQFAHTIRQLLEKGISYITDLKMSIKEVSATLTQARTVINSKNLTK